MVTKTSKSRRQTPPQEKISEAFLDLTAPILVTMPSHGMEGELEHVLQKKSRNRFPSGFGSSIATID